VTGRRPLRVCQIITKLEVGGAQATVVATAAHLAADPEVDVVTLAGIEDDSGGVLWRRARDLGLDVRAVPALRRSVRPIADLRAVQQLRRALREIAPDVVHTHSSKAGVLGRLAASAEGLPVVHTIHGWSSICGDQGPAARAGVVGIERWLGRRTARLVVVTEVDRTIGLAAGIGREDQYTLVRSPLDAADAAAARRSRAESRAGLDLGPDDFVVGSVARLAAPKDPFTLLRAFGRLSSARPTSMLVLIGGGPLEDALRVEATAAGMADRVRFVGSHPRAAQLVGAFDVAVLASRWEGLPRTIVEAAAARIPIVANCVGGVGDIVEDGISGWCFPVGDDRALTVALGRILDDPAGTARMVDVAEHRVQGEFGIDAVTDQLSDLWRLAAAAPVRAPEPSHAS